MVNNVTASYESDCNSDSSKDFIRTVIEEDLRSGKFDGQVVTRFPPEPNGYLHIGHAKAICLNFGIAKEFGGRCHLRFDDTNPAMEEDKYVDAIMEDIRWLGWEWGDHLYFASDHFSKLYEFALILINGNKAYVDDLSQDEIREYRGTLTKPGKESPFRDRSVEENIDLFRRMKNGEFQEGSRVLRAKIDMASGNINMRDPVIYRILQTAHHRTGDDWCIYPMYDFAHGQSDSIEGVTHSLCSMEYEDHRPLYNWFLEALNIFHPEQTEFARLNLSNSVMSKRTLLKLVNDGHVSGWDDPRMHTLAAMRRRGYPPEAIRNFCTEIGVAKRQNVIELALLEHHVREVLNRTSGRVMGVMNPLKVVIENYPQGQFEELDAINNPEDPESGTRKLRFSRELYIEKDDFLEHPPKKFFRLFPGNEVRLRYGYFITCVDVIKDPDTGEITELRCRYDPDTKGGQAPDGRRVRGTIHWVSADNALDAEVRLFDSLFKNSDSQGFSIEEFNEKSIEVLKSCKVELSLAAAELGVCFQFERVGYFCLDRIDTRLDSLVFNRTVSLRDSWAKTKIQR